MTNQEKIEELEKVIALNTCNENIYFEMINKISDIKNYWDYMSTEPVNCDEELKRLDTADYELCAALLTMLLREDHFNEGAFYRRYQNGQVHKIIYRMIENLR